MPSCAHDARIWAIIVVSVFIQGARMISLWRPLALAAAVSIGVGVSAAAAQTVIMRKVPPGAKVEVLLNTTTAGAAAADDRGDATVRASIEEHLEKSSIDAFISVETCGETHRIVIVERGAVPPPIAPECERREIPGLFLVRRVSTIVIDATPVIPSVLLVQGRFDPDAPDRGTLWRPAPAGIVLFGGAGFGMFGGAEAVACGALTGCSGDDSGTLYAAGVTYWLSPYLGVEGSYVRPADATFNGSGTNYRFDSFLDAYYVTVSGKVGVPVKAVRFYGHGGANYHRAVLGTTQTFDEVTITVDGRPQVVRGGTQAFQLETGGWGWVIGGGFEAWMTRYFGFYGQFDRAKLKGSAIDGTEGLFEDSVTSAVLGIRLRIGG